MAVKIRTNVLLLFFEITLWKWRLINRFYTNRVGLCFRKSVKLSDKSVHPCSTHDVNFPSLGVVMKLDRKIIFSVSDPVYYYVSLWARKMITTFPLKVTCDVREDEVQEPSYGLLLYVRSYYMMQSASSKWLLVLSYKKTWSVCMTMATEIDLLWRWHKFA